MLLDVTVKQILELFSSSADKVKDVQYVPPPPKEATVHNLFYMQYKSLLAHLIIYTVSPWEQLVFYNCE